MTRTRYRIYETEYPYLITSTINGWLPVFTKQLTADIVFDSWKYLQRERDLKIYAYVILENHLHLVAFAPELSDVIQRFKSWTARQIIKELERRRSSTLLRQLKCAKLRHKRESEYQVWQEGSKPKQIADARMMEQKIEYIHNNPVERGFVEDPAHWRWSSARDYAGRPGLVDVCTEWRL